jgi:signal transduction histidine kinase
VVQVLEIFRDITSELTERMERRTQAIKDDLARLVQEDKLISLGKLVASVAHEINNPIGSIINFSKLVLRCMRQEPPERWEPGKWEQWLQLTVDEAERCREIVRNLLSFARQQGMEPRQLDLVQVIGQIVKVISHRLEIGKVTLDLRLTPHALEVRGDVTQIQQCFTNLMFNALEAMPGGGKLTIQGGHDDHEVFVTVTDTGEGIPEAVMPRIFEPFFSTKSAVAGVGLGLSMVHGIVSEHGGRIEVDSTIGEGTSFRVSLPRCGPGAGRTMPGGRRP